MTRTAILGAGALGLTSAMRLARLGGAVTVLERESLPGGLAAGFEIEPGMWLEKFYHHLFRSDTRAIAMIEELGLGDRLGSSRPAVAARASASRSRWIPSGVPCASCARTARSTTATWA